MAECNSNRIALYLLSHLYLVYILSQSLGTLICCGEKALSKGPLKTFHFVHRKVCKTAHRTQIDLAYSLSSQWPCRPGLRFSTCGHHRAFASASPLPDMFFPDITLTVFLHNLKPLFKRHLLNEAFPDLPI